MEKKISESGKVDDAISAHDELIKSCDVTIRHQGRSG
jgi:hypothetical protein